MASGDDKKGVMLLGRDLGKIPCMRTALLSGIGGGLGVGLLSFLMTSNVRRSSNVGFGAYIAGTIGAWAYCRYEYSRTHSIEEKIMLRAIQESILAEGTTSEVKTNDTTKS